MNEHQNFIIYKPYGYLSQFVNNQNRRRNKKLLGELSNFPEGTMSVGRLDEKSEGLLFLTTDGRVSEAVRSKKVEKEYCVLVDGRITDAALQQMREGLDIRINRSIYKTLPAKVNHLPNGPQYNIYKVKERDARHGPTSWITVTISEGKYRQVRKMTAAVGFPTLRLIRVRIGNTTLNHLQDFAPKEVESFDY